jgi:hypothetical protein
LAEWTDREERTREAVTLRARKVVFEGGPQSTSSDRAGEPGGGRVGAATSDTAEPAVVSVSSPAGSASAENLPF